MKPGSSPFVVAAAVALRAGLCTAALVAAVTAFAQAIPVTTPRLPPRAAAGPAPQPGTYAPAAAQTGAAQTGAQTGAYSGVQAGPHSGAYAGAYAGAQAAGQPAYGAPAAQTAYASPGGYAAPAPTVMPQRAPAGACRAQPTPDRQAVVLVSGAEALARSHVPLGEFRAQQVVHSPDGRWAVVFTKLRGAPQYAALTIDLERCEVQRSIDLAAAGEDARFEGDEALLRIGAAERRVALRDGRVR